MATILIIIAIIGQSQGGISVTSVEYNTPEACERAAVQIRGTSHLTARFSAICTPKK